MSADPGLMPRTARHPGGSRGAAGAGRVSWRVVLLAGRAEAARLCRSPLVLAGLVIAATLIWWNSRTMVPQWWVWDVQIGSCLLAVAGAVLVAAQLAASRARRDGLAHLYDSYPTPASARTIAYLLGAAGPLALTVILAGAAVIWLDLSGPVGAPRLTVLAQGLVLVALGAAIGVALGSYLPHPIAGILAVLVLGAAEADLILPFGGPVQLPGGTAWLFPWTQPVVLHWLPGPTSVIPPATHLAWLAALTALAVILALWRPVLRIWRTWLTALAALSAAGCLAVAGWSGWVQTRPVPASTQDSLLGQITHPAQAEQCISQQHVRYCAYPGFRPDVARWATVVNGVLGLLPSLPARTLVVRQVVDTDIYTAPLQVGYERATTVSWLETQIGRFIRAQNADPHLIPGSSVPPVYVDTGWGTGSAAGPYQLGLAVQAAWWVASLPTTWQEIQYHSDPHSLSTAVISCLPDGQAREAIALWLAASATPAARATFLADLNPINGVQPITADKVGGTWISVYTGVTGDGYQPAVQFTSQGAALAKAMLRLPQRRVTAVLSSRWPAWLSPHATDAQLAAALGIPLPAVPSPPPSIISPGQPADPVCQ